MLSEIGSRNGRLAEWLMQRIANPSISVQFRYRPPSLFRLSSAVEQSAVNRLVVGSNPTVGAKETKRSPLWRPFCFLNFGYRLEPTEVGLTTR